MDDNVTITVLASHVTFHTVLGVEYADVEVAEDLLLLTAAEIAAERRL